MASMHLASSAHIATKPMALTTPKTQKRATTTTRALFTKRKPAPVVEEPKPAKKSGFSLFGGKKTETATTSGKKTTAKVDKAAEYKRKESVLSAFDFSTARSKSDAELLYDARYGKLKDGKMTPEQAAALRRKVGGTAKDFWKTSIDVEGKYTDKGYVSEEGTNVPALPLLVGVVVALFGTLGYVVSQTGQ